MVIFYLFCLFLQYTIPKFKPPDIDNGFYLNCTYGRGVDDPALWAGKVGNSWRTTDDINDSWARFCNLSIFLLAGLKEFLESMIV